MANRRSGRATGFWNNAAVGVAGVSPAIELGRGIENLALYITVSAATTVSLEAAHGSDVTSEGILSDTNAANWGKVIYGGAAVEYIFAAAGSIVLLVPDFTPGWIRLRSSAAATITAGFEVSSG